MSILKNMLDTLFREKPIYERGLYLNSGTMQLRKLWLPVTSGANDKWCTLTHSLPKCMTTPVRLGPYEQSLLAQVLNATENVILFRGGSRSGKTSTLIALRNYCGIVSNNLEDKGPFSFFNFFSLIDLRTISEVYKDHQEFDDLLLSQVKEQLVDTLADQAFAALRTDLGDEQFVLLVNVTFGGRTIGSFPDGEYSGSDGLLVPWTLIHDYIDWDEYRELKTREKLSIFAEALNSLHGGAKRYKLFAAFLVFLVLGRTTNMVNPRRQWVVAVDNTDLLPEQLQQYLVQEIRGITASGYWTSVKIVLSARLSTSKTYINALEKHHIIDHESPEPVDLVWHNLIRFILYPNLKVYDLYKSSFERERREVRIALIALLCHLVDNRGEFNELLSAIAGTNIITCYELVKKWCQNDLILQTSASESTLSQCEEEARRICFRGHVYYFSQHAIRALSMVLGQVGASDRGLTDLAIEIAGYLGQIAKDMRFSCYPPPSTDFVPCPRRWSFMGGVSQHEEHLRHDELVNDFFAFHVWDNIKDIGADNAIEVVAGVQTAIAGALGKICLDNGCVVDEEMVRALTDFIGRALGKVIKMLHDQHHIVLDDETPVIESTSTITNLMFRHLSRYEAAKLLLDSGASYGRSNVVNAFAHGILVAEPVVLDIVYALYARRNYSLQVGDLLRYMSFFGYTAEMATEGISVGVTVETRLFFCDVADHLKGTDQWRKDPTKTLQLSRAGIDYYNKVIVSPTYVQWAFSKIAELQAVPVGLIRNLSEDTLLGRVAKTLSQFRYFLPKQLDRLQQAYSHAPKGIDPSAFLSAHTSVPVPLFDVYLKVADRFVRILHNRRNKAVKDHEGNIGDYNIIMREWASDAALFYAQIRRIYPNPVIEWETKISHLNYDVERFIAE